MKLPAKSQHSLLWISAYHTPKISIISNAGYGVFISCKSVLSTGEDFQVEPW
jgi:hypothetical protein